MEGKRPDVENASYTKRKKRRKIWNEQEKKGERTVAARSAPKQRRRGFLWEEREGEKMPDEKGKRGGKLCWHKRRRKSSKGFNPSNLRRGRHEKKLQKTFL